MAPPSHCIFFYKCSKSVCCLIRKYSNTRLDPVWAWLPFKEHKWLFQEELIFVYSCTVNIWILVNVDIVYCVYSCVPLQIIKWIRCVLQHNYRGAHEYDVWFLKENVYMFAFDLHVCIWLYRKDTNNCLLLLFYYFLTSTFWFPHCV